MSRKLKFFSDQINKAGVKSSVRPALQPEIDLEELEAGGILAASQNHATPADQELDEHIYDKEVDEGNCYLLEQGIHQGASESGVRFVSGIVLKSKALAFERMFFRSTRGNMFFNQAPAGEPVTDPISGDEVEKTVFAVYFSGEQTRAIILRICASFGASCYPVPEEMVKQRQIFHEVSSRLSDLELTLDAGIKHENKAPESIGSQLEVDNNGMLNFDVTRNALLEKDGVPYF